MKKLERRLNLTSVIAISIGGMLGSGIFVLPGIAAAKTGPSIWMAYLLAGLCVLPAALSKSELATAMPTSGGTYVYIERAFGPMFGTISGIGLWLSLLLKSSFALVGFGAYLYVFAEFPLKTTALSCLILILILNVLGVKKVGKVQIVVVGFSLIGLIAILVFGLPIVESTNLNPAFTNGTTGLLAATAFVFISYAGVTKVAAIAEEIKNPGRNLPLGMLITLLLIASMYSLISFTLVGNIPIPELAQDIRPIYTLASYLGGNIAGIIAAGIGVVTLISMANSGVLASSRFPFAMSRDQLLPEFLSKVHQKYMTPVATILATCIAMALVILFLDVEKIAKLASAFQVMMFVAVNAALIVLRETAVQWYTPTYRSPLYPWVQVFGILSGLLLLVILGWLGLLAAALIFVIGIAVYYAYGSSRVQRSGVLKIYGHRPALYLLYNRKQRKNPAKPDFKPSLELGVKNKANLDGVLANNAHVVVPLFGNERSSEMLVEIGAALAPEKKLQVVHLNEVPDQTLLDALLIDNVTVTSLNRRVAAMAEEKQLNVDFDAAVTHDLTDTVATISNQTHCRWMVLSWDGRASNGLLVRNPIGWLVSHINSNFALYKDKGVRYIRKILIARRPGRDDQEFLQTCDQIAQFYQASITMVRVVAEGTSVEEKQATFDSSTKQLESCQSRSNVVILMGKNPVTVVAEASAGYDLLITGTPTEGNLRNILLGRGRDKFAEKAACSVLRLTITSH